LKKQVLKMRDKNLKESEIVYTIARIKAGILAFVTAILGGTLIFVMTAWLLIKGGPFPGYHLRLLGEYFIGYTVSWTGCFVGFFYGALVGGGAGWMIGIIYNRIVKFKLRDKA